MDFRTYGLREMSLVECLKSTISEDPLTSNMLNGPKHCSKPNQSTFTKFRDPSESN